MKNLLLVFFTLAICAQTLSAGDWPMWRHDTERSGSSPENIADKPIVLWSRKLVPVDKAWPLENKKRLDFDASYEPITLGKLLYISSPNDGSVTAFDTDSGEEKWKFFTDGPIRCAPICWKNKIYFGSDDGYLYCLDNKTGKLIWKFRGAPKDRPDKRLLGNGHLISFWPVRGGAVIKDGILYFGAGIWPIFGVFYYAIDADTAKIKWMNSELDYVSNVKIDHERNLDMGLSPQGHFLITSNRLIVPNGRSMPAGLELDTGKLIYYAQGYRNGDSRVTAHGDYAFVGKTGVLNLYDFREVGSKWAKTGAKGPEGATKSRDFYESPYFPYKLAEACNASSVLDNGVAYGSNKGEFFAYDIANAKFPEHKKEVGTKVTRFLKWQPPVLWKYKTKFKGASVAMAKAGKRIYGHIGKKLVAIENLEGEPTLAWEKNLKGTPSSIIAADNKLFVATKEGWIYCLGEGKAGKIYAEKPVQLAEINDGWKKKVENIIKTTGVKSGYCLIQGINDGRLIEELLKQTELTVLAVDENHEKIISLKKHFEKSGFLGSRVELFNGKPFGFLFPPYIASLMLSENKFTAEQLKNADLAKIFNILRPYGGTLLLEMDEKVKSAFKTKLASAKLAKGVLKTDANYLVLSRKGALPGSDDWTHESADAGRSFFSKDELVKAPLGFLWFGDENGFVQYNDYGLGVKPQIKDGRLYAMHQRARKLYAYDVYTGRFLWTAPTGSFYARMAALDDGIYLASNGKCVVYDPKTGKVLNSFTFDEDGANSYLKDIKVDGEVIVIAFNKEKNRAIDAGYWDSSTLVCLDRKTGKELWRRKAKDRFNNAGIAIADGMVFCVDSVSMAKTDKWQKRTKGLTHTDSTLYALDARTEKELWTAKINTPYSSYGQSGWTKIQSSDDWLAYSANTGIILFGRQMVANAYDAKTGEVIWKDKMVGEAPIMIRDDKTFLNQGYSPLGAQVGYTYDLLTGARIGDKNIATRAGCNYAVASKHLMMVRDATVSYTDVETKTIYHLRNIRSGCSASIVAADGVLNVPNYAGTCVCNYPIVTSFAMITMPEIAKWATEKAVSMNVPPSLVHKGRFARIGPIPNDMVKLPELMEDIKTGKIGGTQNWHMNDDSIQKWVERNPENNEKSRSLKVKLFGDNSEMFVIQSKIVSAKAVKLDVSMGPSKIHGIFLNGENLKGKTEIKLKAGENKLAIVCPGGETFFLRPNDPTAAKKADINFESPVSVKKDSCTYSPPAGVRIRKRITKGWRAKITGRLPKAKTMHAAHPDKGISDTAQKAVQENFDDSSWNEVEIPKLFETYGKDWADADGEVVYRLNVDVPKEWAGKDLLLSLGAIDDFDNSFWNGIPVGKTDKSVRHFYSKQRRYSIPGKIVKPGRNVIAVRLFDHFGSGGMRGPEKNMFIEYKEEN